MKIKYSPVKFNEYADSKSPADTVIKYKDENTIRIDGELYEFDSESIQFPDVFTETDGIILEAHRDELNEFYVTVRRFYSNDCSAWDNGEYNEING